MRHFVSGALAVAAILAANAAAAGAQDRAPAETIRMRQANYKQMGAAMKGLNEEMRGGRPSLATVRRHAAVIARHAPMVLRWFPHGSGPEAGVRTRAKAAIWTDPHGFRRAGAALLLASGGLSAAARRGDMAAIRTAVPALANACGGCHEDYRGPEQ